MALIIRDSFDPYALSFDLVYHWDVVYTNDNVFFNLVNGTNTRFNVGQAISWVHNFGSVVLGKRFGSNESTVFTVFAMHPDGLSGSSVEDCALRFWDGTTVQCTVVFTTSGDINVYRGDYTNGGTRTLLHTFAGTYSGLVWTHWQVKVILDGTNGEVHIRKNGNTVDDYAVTGLNTLMTANAYANYWDLSSNGGGNGIVRTIDDLVLYSGSGTGVWTDWIGDIRAEQLAPVSDTAQKDFTPNITTVLFGNDQPQNGQGTSHANAINYWLVTAAETGSLGPSGVVHVATTPGTGNHLVMGLYDSDGTGGTPGTLLAISSVMNFGSTGGPLAFTWSASPTLVRNHVYYWAALSDNNWNVNGANAGNVNQYVEGFTYAGASLPSTATPIGNGSTNFTAIQSTIIDLTNSGLVGELIYDKNSTYVVGNAVNDFDLYDISGMTTTPSGIFGVTMRMLMAKSDTDARQATATIKSGTTQVDGASKLLSSDYQLYDFEVDLDPDTGLPWTAVTLNNITFGPKVVA